jgi:ribonuclease-3 family protein
VEAEMTDHSEHMNLFYFQPVRSPDLLNPIVLAYVGDALHEIYIRQYALSLSNQKPQQLHRFTTKYVSAKAQASALEKMMPILTEKEIEVVKRGRNAKSGSSPNRTDILVYRHSTAFECLLGYLYYDQQHLRLKEILDLSIAQ